MRVQPRPVVGVAVLLAYLVVFYGVWIVNGIEYDDIGDSADTLLRWYVAPLAAGAVVLVVAATVLGWWRPALSEQGRRAPRWTLVPAALMALLAVGALATKTFDDTTGSMWTYLLLGSIGVGFCEELATRGMLVVGLRGTLTEPRVWFFSTLAFGLLHLPNAVFGAGPAAVAQVVLAFLAGTTLYLLRRGSGSLVPAMLLHALWDFSTFAGEGGAWVAAVDIGVGMLALVLVLVLLRRERGVRLDPRPSPVPAA